ncbi:MAG: hypothetical protein JXQ69_08125 [Paludibacteraceae bacterium]|nr:hypothetical protein [Paludibacteraceae bacterium]
MIYRIANSSFFQEKQVAGVHIEILSENEFVCNFVVLKKKKGSIHIIQKNSCLLEKLSKKLSNKTVIFLSIDGKGVLLREQQQTDLSNDELISHVFPNVKSHEFYVQHIKLANDNMLVYFARKNTIDSILSQLKEQGFSCLQLNLGCLTINIIAAIVENGNVHANSYNISIKNGLIESTNKTNDNNSNFTLIGEERIEYPYVIPYATGLSYFINKYETDSNNFQITEDQYNHAYLKIIKKGGIAFLLLIFVILLINFFIFCIQNDRQKSLAKELSQYQSTILQLTNLKSEIAEKEKIMQNSAWEGNSFFAFYADRIAASKPDGISFEKMEIFPVKINNNKFDFNSLQKDTILIMGITKNSLLLNDWTKVLRKHSFVKSVNISNYTQEESSSGKFTLVLAVQPKIK